MGIKKQRGLCSLPVKSRYWYTCCNEYATPALYRERSHHSCATRANYQFTTCTKSAYAIKITTNIEKFELNYLVVFSIN